MKSKKSVAALMMCCLIVMGLLGTKIPAYADGGGVMYYQLLKNSSDTLSAGNIYISTNGNLEDMSFASVNFPSDILSAELEVTGDRENATYGSGTYGDGYPVNVIQRDSQFDSCDDGHLFYSTDEGAWRYYCNYGGAQNAGPYYLYSVGTVNFTEQNIFVSESDTYAPGPGANTITNSDLNVHIVVSDQGLDYQVTNFTFLDDQVNFPDDVTVTLDVGGVSVNFNMRGKEAVPMEIGRASCRERV